MDKILNMLKNMSKSMKIGAAAGCGVVIVIIVVLVVVLGGSSSGDVPGKKVMTDARAYLTQLQRQLDDNAEPRLPCVVVPGTNGSGVRAEDCPPKGETNRWWQNEDWYDPNTPWPFHENEVGGGGDSGGGDSGGCSDSCGQ